MMTMVLNQKFAQVKFLLHPSTRIWAHKSLIINSYRWTESRVCAKCENTQRGWKEVEAKGGGEKEKRSIGKLERYFLFIVPLQLLFDSHAQTLNH